MADPIIRATGLTKRFGTFTAVDDLTITVEPGTIFAFLGANGSGKSTTIRMLIGLLQPTAGSIEVDGIDVIKNPRRVRDHIGYMGQKVSLYQGLSIRENVEFYAGLFDLSPERMEQSWGALRERFHLQEAESEKTEDLPAGIRQRAGLALSILHQPRVVFLDEPTAGVDVHSRSLFWELIQEEATKGATVFVTTHFLEEVDYCDWVAFIDNGRLIANAEPEALRQRYSAGYRVHLQLAVAQRDRAEAALRQMVTEVQQTSDGLSGVFREAKPELLKRLDSLAREANATLSLEQVPMTEVFRNIVAEGRQAS